MPQKTLVRQTDRVQEEKNIQTRGYAHSVFQDETFIMTFVIVFLKTIISSLFNSFV